MRHNLCVPYVASKLLLLLVCVRFIAAFTFAGRKYLCALTFDRYNRSTQQFALLYAAELQTFVTVCVCVLECVFCILFINIFYFSCMCAAATPLLLILLSHCLHDFIYFRFPFPRGHLSTCPAVCQVGTCSGSHMNDKQQGYKSVQPIQIQIQIQILRRI